jgi:nucleoside-diphosphate-sugar epimerase
MSAWLVTGGAGFIGSHIVARLAGRGETVRVIDNLSTGCIDNIRPLFTQIKFYNDDIRRVEAVDHIMDGVDYVLHQAALPSVPRSINNPAATNDTNVNGTLNLLLAAKKAKVKRVVIASSSSVYGDSEKLPKVETMPTNPLSPYATSKLAAENYAHNFSSIYGMEIICLRYFNVFGPRQNPNSQYAAVIPKLIQAFLNNESPTIFGDGEQSRDFTYVENVVNANLLAAVTTKANAGVFNIGCGAQTSLNKVMYILEAITGNNPAIINEPARQGDVKHSKASIKLARHYLDYDPQVSFEGGLESTVRWWRENNS